MKPAPGWPGRAPHPQSVWPRPAALFRAAQDPSGPIAPAPESRGCAPTRRWPLRPESLKSAPSWHRAAPTRIEPLAEPSDRDDPTRTTAPRAFGPSCRPRAIAEFGAPRDRRLLRRRWLCKFGPCCSWASPRASRRRRWIRRAPDRHRAPGSSRSAGRAPPARELHRRVAIAAN